MGLPDALFRPHWEQKAGAVFSAGIGGRGLSSSPLLAPPAPPPGKLLHCYSTVHSRSTWSLVLLLLSGLHSLSLSLSLSLSSDSTQWVTLWYGSIPSSNLQYWWLLSLSVGAYVFLWKPLQALHSLCALCIAWSYTTAITQKNSQWGRGGKVLIPGWSQHPFLRCTAHMLDFRLKVGLNVLCEWVSEQRCGALN